MASYDFTSAMVSPTIRPLTILGFALVPAMMLGALAFAPAFSPFQEPAPDQEPAQELPSDFPALKLTQLADGLTQPLYGKAAPGQPDRLYILEKGGKIKILELSGRVRVREEPFLDISAKVSTRSERGLLGLAFAADYVQSGIFYIHYNNLEGDTILARMIADPENRLRAKADSEEILLQEKQPWANHDGGELCFGPDGMLYLGLGDGGAANDPQNNGQKPGSLLGKILRVDVSGGVGSPYTIPDDNPFVGFEAVPAGDFTGSVLTYWDDGPVGGDAHDGGTVAPPIVNLPPFEPDYGEDPHSLPRKDPTAQAQKSAFLMPGDEGKFVDTCDPALPCFVDGYSGGAVSP